MSSAHHPARKPGLGRGLDTLFEPTAASPPSSSGDLLLSLPVAQIRPNPQQPRTLLPTHELEALAESIRQSGILQPIVVQPHAEQPGQYWLIAGERRWRSAQMAGLTTIPALIRQVSPADSLVLSLAENIQRSELSPVEQAVAFDHLAATYGYTHAQIAQAMGMSRVAVTNLIRLLRLPASVRDALTDQQITHGHARALLALPDLNDAADLVRRIRERDLTVRQTEALVRRHVDQASAASPQSDTPAGTSTDPDLQFVERQLSRHYQTKVRIQRRVSGGGRLTLHFYSDDGLNHLLTMLLEEAEQS